MLWIGLTLAITLSSLTASATMSETRAYVGHSPDGEVTCLYEGLLSPPVPGQGGACFDVPLGLETLSVVVSDDNRPVVRFTMDEFDASGRCTNRHWDDYLQREICESPMGIVCGTQASLSLDPRTVAVEVVLSPYRHWTTIAESCVNGGGGGSATTGTITATFSS